MEYNEKKMRRFVQQLPPEDAKSILATATNGVLSLIKKSLARTATVLGSSCRV